LPPISPASASALLPEPLCLPLIAKVDRPTHSDHAPPSPLSLAWRKDHHGKAVQDIASLFSHSAPEITGFLTLFSNTP
jgi:LysR family transcriptional activator of the allD operon